MTKCVVLAEAVKAVVRLRMHLPHTQTVARIAEELGIHVVTLYNWRTGGSGKSGCPGIGEETNGLERRRQVHGAAGECRAHAERFFTVARWHAYARRPKR